MSLERAIEQLAAGDHGGYETLREVWRACRCAELAEQLERIGRAAGRPAFAKATQAAWIERAREGDPLDVAGLFDNLAAIANPRNASRLAACLDELVRHADDPQLTKPLLALLEVEASSSSWNKVHTRIFQLLEGTGDPRVIEGLAPAIERAAHPEKGASDSMTDSLGRATRTRDRLAKRFPDGVPPAPKTKLLAKLATITPERATEARAAPVSELGALLQAIYDDPTDLARRAVYADALLEIGDPRGELITLQLSDRIEAKLKATRLIEKHRKHLLGPLAKVAQDPVFEGGFLAACETDVRRKVQADAIFGLPEWATVKRITFRGYSGLSSHMRALEEARGVDPSGLEALATATLPRLRVLGTTFIYTEPSNPSLRALATTRGLPALRVFMFQVGAHSIKRPEDYAWLLDAPCWQHLEEVWLPAPYEPRYAAMLAPWAAYMRTHPTLRAIHISVKGAAMAVVKDGDKLVPSGSTPAHVDIMREALGGLV